MRTDRPDLDIDASVWVGDNCRVVFKMHDDYIDMVFKGSDGTLFEVGCSPSLLKLLAVESADAVVRYGQWMESAEERERAEQAESAAYRARVRKDPSVS